MSAYELTQRPTPVGLGYVEAIAAILGPLVEGGASIYGTSVASSQNKKALRQRRKEFDANQILQAKSIEAQQRQFALAQQASIQQAQISAARTQRAAPYVTAAVGFAALAFVASMALRKKKRK